MEIRHRFSQTTLCSFEVETICECLESAVKDRVNMYEADLRGANLSEANLYGANLYGANLDGERLEKNPLVVVGLTYWCLISDNYLRLGCKRFTHAEWAEFNDDQIAAMDSCALVFWTQWKAPLLAMCAAYKGADHALLRRQNQQTR